MATAKKLSALRPVVPAQGYYRLSPTIQIYLPHGRTVFIKQALFPTHRTLYQAFGARHPSSVTPLTGRASFPPGEAKGLCEFARDFMKPSLPTATPLRLAKSRLTAVARLHGACASHKSGPLGLPAQLCMKQLYAALWSATPAKPFRGAFGWETLQGGEYGKDIGFDHRQDAAGI